MLKHLVSVYTTKI